VHSRKLPQNILNDKSSPRSGISGYSYNRKSECQSYSNSLQSSGSSPGFYQPMPSYSNFIRLPHSLNDSGNFNLEEDSTQMYYNNVFGSIRPHPKRTNSASQIEIKKMSGKSGRGSLFMNVLEKEEKGEDFADLHELMKSINIPLWDYAKTQRGSRNLQKLLNKIEPSGLDEILEFLKNNFPELMVDTYGNYFCQKLIQSCSSRSENVYTKTCKQLMNLINRL